MSDVYMNCPEFENDRYRIRFVNREDSVELLEIYSDKNALPFFNSDNCDGDNFYYQSVDRMNQAIDFWLKSYETRWFVRWTIIDKSRSKIIGTIEMFHRIAEDDFNHAGVLRLDLRSDCENDAIIQDVLELFLPSAYELFDCGKIITKIPVYAIERMKALGLVGFKKSEKFLIGTNDQYAYKDYWMIEKN